MRKQQRKQLRLIAVPLPQPALQLGALQQQLIAARKLGLRSCSIGLVSAKALGSLLAHERGKSLKKREAVLPPACTDPRGANRSEKEEEHKGHLLRYRKRPRYCSRALVARRVWDQHFGAQWQVAMSSHTTPNEQPLYIDCPWSQCGARRQARGPQQAQQGRAGGAPLTSSPAAQCKCPLCFSSFSLRLTPLR
jgi:hypothetical protein